MGYRDLSDARAVERALDEYDMLGRDAFLDKYGFGPARRYFVVRDGRRYDSKAVVGAAYGFQHGRPLSPKEFSGGETTVMALLTSLGFEVTIDR